jgi:predicted phage tail protein
MKVVKVYGALRKKLGQCRFQFEADTPAQALKALCINFPGLEKWLLDSENDGVGYRVTIGKEKITAETSMALVLPWSEREVFSITPVVAGAGGGTGQILAGVGLVAFAILTAGAGAGFLGLGAGLTGTAATGPLAAGFAIQSGFVLGSAASIAIGTIGAGLLFTGIAQAISPSPVNSTASVNTYERGRDAAKFESFTFSGIVNTEKQGLPVPIIYGRCFAGSSVISVGIDVDQLI